MGDYLFASTIRYRVPTIISKSLCLCLPIHRAIGEAASLLDLFAQSSFFVP
ncbi:unnamed protein product [Ilex paraguariensis]